MCSSSAPLRGRNHKAMTYPFTLPLLRNMITYLRKRFLYRFTIRNSSHSFLLFSQKWWVHYTHRIFWCFTRPLSLLFIMCYLRNQPQASQQEPLFATEEGKAMSEASLCQSCWLPPEHYTNHSLNIGAATTAVCRAPIPTLKAVGRWSAADECYIWLEVQDIFCVQKAIRNLWLLICSHKCHR